MISPFFHFLYHSFYLLYDIFLILQYPYATHLLEGTCSEKCFLAEL